MVVKQNVLAALQSRRATRHQDALVHTRTRLGERSSLRIEIDVVGDEQIQVAVLVVVDKRAAGIPAALAVARIRRNPGLLGGIGEGSVAIVVPQGAITPVGDVQVVETIIIVVARANALAPASAGNAGFEGDIGKGAVPVVLVEPAHWRLTRWPLGFKAGTVHQKDIEPAIVVVVDEGAAAPGSFE